jgi:FkbM family methyltransferase
MTMRGQIKKAMLHLGYEVRRVDPEQIGLDPFRDMRRLLNFEEPSVLFDVGANRGQSVALLRAAFPSATIHAFEPSPSTFERLKEQTAGISNLHLNNIALGSICERRVLIENSEDTANSLLAAGGDFSWGKVVSHTDVDVASIDSYCEAAGIRHIDVLKSDTQGFDSEVLRGGINMLQQHKIRLVYIELLFRNLYLGMGPFEDIYIFLKDLGFEAVSFYNISWQGSRLGWLDGLFIDPQWVRN